MAITGSGTLSKIITADAPAASAERTFCTNVQRLPDPSKGTTGER
jgi:hypothetical protein